VNCTARAVAWVVINYVRSYRFPQDSLVVEKSFRLNFNLFEGRDVLSVLI